MANKQKLLNKINHIEDEIDNFLVHVNQNHHDKLKESKRLKRQLLIGWILSIIANLIFSTLILMLFVFNTFKLFHK